MNSFLTAHFSEIRPSYGFCIMQDNGTIVHFRYLYPEDDIKRNGEILRIKSCTVTEKTQVGSQKVLCLRHLGFHEKRSTLLESPAYAEGMIDFLLRCVTRVISIYARAHPHFRPAYTHILSSTDLTRLRRDSIDMQFSARSSSQLLSLLPLLLRDLSRFPHRNYLPPGASLPLHLQRILPNGYQATPVLSVLRIIHNIFKIVGIIVAEPSSIASSHKKTPVRQACRDPLQDHLPIPRI